MLDEELDDTTLARLGTSREQLSESLFATLTAQGKEEQDLPGFLAVPDAIGGAPDRCSRCTHSEHHGDGGPGVTDRT